MNVILTTERLRLREMIEDDLDFVAEMLADAEVMRYYPKRYSRFKTHSWSRPSGLLSGPCPASRAKALLHE